MKRFLISPLILLLLPLLLCDRGWANSGLNLPDLGDSTSGIVSHQQEYDMGRAWLRLYRRQVPTYSDPELEVYLENLLARIASHSELRNRDLQLVLVSNPTINAFAAPGGIIGVHSGLILMANTEGEVAGVLSHELAHLSQRHWVRSVEASRQNTLPNLAGLLAGLVLLATSNGQAGMAAIATTQAASLDSQLRFSRQNEQEADNIGMQTLVASGFNADDMTAMFENMLEANRFQGKRPPEYLLSHPVTEKRVADSRSRARSLPVVTTTENIHYQLMRARVQLHHSESAAFAVKRFQSEVDGNTLYPLASRYGLALAQIKTRQFKEAETILMDLLQHKPEQTSFILALANLKLEQGIPDAGIIWLHTVLQKEPTSFPAKILLAKAYLQQRQYQKAEEVYYQLSQQRPGDPEIWYELAEIRGLAGNILGVHLARAEYFSLNGIYDMARTQLEYAQPLLKDNYVESERVKQKLLEIDALENMSLDI